MPPYSLRILKRIYSFAASPLHYAYEAVTLCGRAFQRVQLVFWIKTAPHLHVFCKTGFSTPSAVFVRITYRIALSFLFLRVLRYFSSPRMHALSCTIRQSRVQSLTCGYPGLIAACHGLHRCYSQAIL
jgi:hypothetical protein